MKINKLFLLFCIMLMCAGCNTKSTEDYFCDWKAVSLRYRAKGLRGDLPLGSEIGRTITFKKGEIIDGKSEEETSRENIANYSGKYEYSELIKLGGYTDAINQIDLLVEYGRTEDFKWLKNPIYKLKYVYYAEDEYPITGYEVISYGEDSILGWLNGGFYEFERFAKQEANSTPFGCWYVKNRVSRTSEYDKGIEYYEHYGEIYDFELLEDEENRWVKHIYDTREYERNNNIIDRLGVANNQICVWENITNKCVVIPINSDYILTELDGTWYRLESITNYLPQKSEKSLMTILELGYDWKRTQFVGGNICYDTSDPWFISNLYTSGCIFNTPIIEDSLLDDISEYTCSLQGIKDQFSCPFINGLSDDEEVSLLKYYDKQQEKDIVWIYIDDDTLLNSIDDSWFIIKRMQ